MRGMPFTANTEGLGYLIAIQKGLETLRFTTLGRAVTYAGDVYQPGPGATVTNLKFPSDVTPTNCDVIIKASDGGIIQTGDAAKGLLDYWPITVHIFDISNPSGTAYDLIPAGTIGSAVENSRGEVTIAANGQLTKARKMITEHYALEGRESLGDDRCKVPIMPADIGRATEYVRPDFNQGNLPENTGVLRVNDAYGRFRTGDSGTVTDYANVYYECTTAGTTDITSTPSTFNPTPGVSSVDGTATFICRNAWTRWVFGRAIGPYSIQFEVLPDPRASDTSWYVLGAIYLRDGPLGGFPKIPIRIWDPSTLIATLFLPVSITNVPAHTQMEVHAGCDWTREMCYSRFDVPEANVRQIWNIRAEYFVPPPETAIQLSQPITTPVLATP